MRSFLYSLLSLATIASVLAAEVPDISKTTSPEKDTDDWDEEVPDTIFNGQTVPPMKELSSVNIEQELNQGNW
jgi:protein disulfide-isomerase